MKLRKILAVLLSVMIIFVVLPLGIFTSSAATSGTTGNCAWTLNNGTLTISGKGAMGDYSLVNGLFSYAPWFSSKTDIVKVVIKNGVTSIGDYAFSI